MKFENTEVMGMMSALRGMRNPMNSWARSDSYPISPINIFTDPAGNPTPVLIGEKDMKTCKALVNAPSDSDSKFLRMIYVTVDITAPTYWWREADQYKISTVTDSCSLQHTGMKRDFTIKDFTVDDSRIYDVLNSQKRDFKAENPLKYSYDTDEYKIYTAENGRNYRVYKNGRIVGCEFKYTDSYGTGRERIVPEKEITPYQTPNGYWRVNIGGAKREKHLVHRLVAELFITKPQSSCSLEINHKDKNRGNNCVENLEWVTHSQNELCKYETYTPSLATKYNLYKKNLQTPIYTRMEIRNDWESGKYQTIEEVCRKYNLSRNVVDYIINDKYKNSELFETCLIWEDTLNKINSFRQLYDETKDYRYFRKMRQMLPMGYNYKETWSANYAVIRNIVRQRKNHKLSEWHDFCAWAKTLPYADLLIFGEG